MPNTLLLIIHLVFQSIFQFISFSIYHTHLKIYFTSTFIYFSFSPPIKHTLTGVLLKAFRVPCQCIKSSVNLTEGEIRGTSAAMSVSVSILAVIITLHLIAFVLAIGAERRRSTAKVVPDKYDESTYCVYGSDASTVYGLAAFGLLLISQAVVNAVTKCFCFGKGLMGGYSTAWAVFLFIFSWVSFLGAEACLLAGSARNAYHTKYRGIFHGDYLSCATLRKGVFAAGAALSLLSMVGSILYYWVHSKADTGGWKKHQNEGLGMSSMDFAENEQQPRATGQFEKL